MEVSLRHKFTHERRVFVVSLVGAIGLICIGRSVTQLQERRRCHIGHNVSFHFRTYGDSKFRYSKVRLVHEARASGWFDTAVALGPSDLPTAFKRRYVSILRESRGGGYWIWKFAVFRMALDVMSEGDVLVYLDAGCEINPKGGGKFWEYIDMLRASPYDVISFEMTYAEHKWTTNRVFDAFNVRNESIRASGQYVGGIIVMRKGPHLRRWLRLVDSVLEADPWLITDRYNREAKAADPDFIEARHDQSIMSVSRKIVGSVVVPYETDRAKRPRLSPFWASRIRV